MTSQPVVDRLAQPDRGLAFRFRRDLPLHPPLLAAAFVLNTALSAGVDARSVVRPLGFAVIAVLLVTVAASLLIRNRHAAGLGVTVLLGALVAPQFGGLVAAVIARLQPWQSALWLACLAAAVAMTARIVAKRARRWRWSGVTSYLNVFAAVLLIVVGLSTVASGAFAQAARDLGVLGPKPVAASETTPTAGASPDVIVLLLDGYPRADTLARHFDLDNQPFLDALRERGFDVADGSRSNYTFTQLTLTSMLHMRHLDDLAGYRDITEGRVAEDPRVRNLINDNPVFDQFRELDYQLVSIPPGIDRVSIRTADTVHESDQLGEFEYHLLRSTAVGDLIALVDPAFMARQHRDRVISAFDRLEDIGASSPGGRFIFAHVLTPHLPIVFRSDGSLNPATYNGDFFVDNPGAHGLEADEFVVLYRDQLEWLNGRVLATFDAVLSANPEAVIVVMADHGSATHFDWRRLDSDLDERFSTLFAARTPGHSGVFTDNQTPINLFPRLFNAYFGTEYELRSDTTYAGVIDFVAVPNPDAER